MKFETSDKGSSYSVKPHIQKGYYPAKLLKVDEFKERSGAPKVGKYGQQLIFEFAIYEKGMDGEPVKPMMFKPEEDKLETYPVKLSKFVYHKYKNTDRNENWINGEFRTAITPNSAMTKLLKALGWTFSGDGVDMNDFIGNWVELNIDDYMHGEGDDAYKASTIQNVNPYEGPAVGEIEDVKPSNPPKSVEKTLKHSDTEEVASEPADVNPEVEKRLESIENLKKLFTDGAVSEDGMKQGITQLEAEIEGLK